MQQRERRHRFRRMRWLGSGLGQSRGAWGALGSFRKTAGGEVRLVVKTVQRERRTSDESEWGQPRVIASRGGTVAWKGHNGRLQGWQGWLH